MGALTTIEGVLQKDCYCDDFFLMGTMCEQD